jgi:hypothetical protein
MSGVTAPLTLSAASARAFNRLAADLARVFGARFVALVAYGPAASVGFAETITADDLEACGVLADTWHRDALTTPLVVTPDEFRRSLDAFPLEYQAILDRHLLIAGRDPFAGCRIDAGDLRRACETQARSHLIHLRQGWMEAGAHAHALTELVARSAAPLRALLTNVARLQGAAPASAEDLAAFAEREAGMSGEVVRAVLALEGGPPEHGPDAAPLLRAYLEATGRLWAYVDAWKQQPPK